MNKFKVLEDIAVKTKPKDEPVQDGFKGEISQDMKFLAEKVRMYVEDQTEFWNKLPYLALEAEGQEGDYEFLPILYEDGYYPIPEEKGKLKLFVDCSNGDIVTEIDGPDKGTLATDSEILYLSGELELIDGKYILNFFEEKAYGNPNRIEESKFFKEWKEETQQKFDIKRVYRRGFGK